MADSPYLRHPEETAAVQQVGSIALQVQEAAVGCLGQVQTARHAPALGRRGNPAAAVEHYERVQLAMALPGHWLPEALAQAVHQVLQPAASSQGQAPSVVPTRLKSGCTGQGLPYD